MQGLDAIFILLHLSTLLVLLLFIQIMRKSHKTQMHYTFLSIMGALIIWCVGVMAQIYMKNINIDLVIYFEYFTYLGSCTLPVFMLFLGLIFAHTKINLSWKYLLLFIIPFISLIVIWTNDYHHLFYQSFSPMTGEMVYGNYFIIHSAYSYICILIGLHHLIYFSIKNSGFFSKQALLIITGSLVPLSVNILFALKIMVLSLYITPITFIFAIVCFLFAIFKYQFLSAVPVALQTVVDLISDSFVVINQDLDVIDYNKTFLHTFNDVFKIKRNKNIINILQSNPALDINIQDFQNAIFDAMENKKSTIFEKHINFDNFDKYFTIEITPIITDNSIIGTIILFKDITQVKKNIETIKEKQAVLMEQERLASLGQLIGGIAHNLKTPIMSLAGAIEGLRDLINEYDESIEDKNVTFEDHHEIASDMLNWLDKMKPHCTYMSDVITTVKGQAVQMNASSVTSFTLDELVKRIDILMKHELIKYNCIMNTEFQVDLNIEIKGEINSLVQIFDNIIINSIHSYDKKSGIIDFRIKKDGNNIEFSITDYGKGIPDQIKGKLFREMVTTKGKNGTGLGLYMSHSNIKGRFGGNIWFTSIEGKGTTFYVSVPCHTGEYEEGVI